MSFTLSDQMNAKEYNELRIAVGFKPLTGKQAERGLLHTTFLVAARDGDECGGMGRVLFDYGYTAYIGDIIVRPDHQGQGIGKAIVEKLIQQTREAADSGDRIMFVLAAAKGKEEFYEKLGFERQPSESLGHGMVMWV